MDVRIEIIRQETPLKRLVWEFNLFTEFKRIVCTSYSKQEKATTRHHWRSTGYWNLYDHWQNNIEVCIPDDVALEIRTKMSEIIYQFQVTTTVR